MNPSPQTKLRGGLVFSYLYSGTIRIPCDTLEEEYRFAFKNIRMVQKNSDKNVFFLS